MAADSSQSIDVRCKRSDCPRVHRCPATAALKPSGGQPFDTVAAAVKALRRGVVSLADCSLIIATEIHGLSCAEVARSESVAEASVRQRKSRTLKKLRSFVRPKKK